MACITGTKGKSTTTAIAVHLLNGLGYEARAGGNIGRPPWDPDEAGDPDYWVVETSSFQVPDLTVAPHVVAVTSLSPDHLDWHGTVERYYADKLSLCTKPGVELALADGSDERLRAQARLLGPHLRWVESDEVDRDTAWSSALGLAGPHNARNASIARAVLAGSGSRAAGDERALASAASGFDGLPSRCARSAGSMGSSSSTTASRPTCCRRRLRSPPSPNGPSRSWWAATTAAWTTSRWPARWRRGRPRPSWSPCPTTARASARPSASVSHGRVEVVDADDLFAAVEAAFVWAQSGGVVLLSPAAPSFGRFGDYRERSAAFAEAAARCGPLS